MTQELNIENHTIRSIKKLFCECCNTNVYYNLYTLADVEDGKKRVLLHLLRKYNYESKEYIQSFINQASNMLIDDLFQSGDLQTHKSNTTMVGTHNVIRDPRKLNPNDKNEFYRIISIDSAYRENMWFNNFDYDSLSSSSMNIEFNDSLDDVSVLELANINIPFTFYNIDSTSGNNYFYIDVNSNVEKIEIDGGNYTNAKLVQAINTKLSASTHGVNLTLAINTNTNKVTIANTGGHDATIIFYDHLDNASFASNKSKYHNQAKLNHNLGWVLGFRNIDKEHQTLEYIVPNTSGEIVSEALCYVSYTKYFVVVIDDLNKNQTNKGLVHISNTKDFIHPTKYFNNKDNSLNCLSNDNFDSYLGESGRNMTKNQLYSALQINNFRKSVHDKNSTLDPHSIGNVFAIIPFENKSLVWGESMFTSDKNRFKRVYHGPVDIKKMQIKLLDDRGNLLNLNGSEWSMTLLSTHVFSR